MRKPGSRLQLTRSFARFLLRFLAQAATLLLAGSALAQQQSVPNAVALEKEAEDTRRYAVEFIVFEYVGTTSGDSEIFLPELPEPVREEDQFLNDSTRPPPADSGPVFGARSAMEFETSKPAPMDEELVIIPTYEQAGLIVLTRDQYTMNGIYDKLDKLDAYRPLLHAAWSQPTLDKEATLPIKLRRLGNPPLRLDGTVTLYLSRFLHLVMDLSLEEKAPQRMSQTNERARMLGDRQSQSAFGFRPEFVAPSIFYRIQEDRIVRNGELRYYDHPKFGVVARITRVEENSQLPVDTTNDLLPGIN